MKPVVVIDTSVWIHYLIRPGRAVRKLVEEFWLSGAIEVAVSPELMDELAGVLARPAVRALIPQEAGQVLLDVIAARARLLPSMGTIPGFTRDPKDDKFVACALLSGAEYLVSLDRDVLVLGALGTVKMVTPVGIVEALG